MNIKHPSITIVMATFNSETTIKKSLDSIKKQNYPKKKIEILVVDGGSTDSTKSIARDYHCKIINNPQREPVPAKYLGFIKAKGDYIIFLDSDEVLENKNSLEIKVNIFLKNTQIKAVIPSGYKKPSGYPSINYYINEFGDPFSFFIYHLSKDSDFLIKTLNKRYKKILSDKESTIFNFYQIKPQPIFELIAMGSMVDAKYLKTNFPTLKKDPSLIPHLFYLLYSKPGQFAVAKNDAVIHYSADTLRKYLKKISSRVKNNIYQTTMGAGGFLGRNQFQPFWFQLKKYLFIPYSLTLVFPILDAFYLSVTRKNPIYLLHPFFCIYTSYLIIYYQILKSLGLKPQMKGYGQ